MDFHTLSRRDLQCLCKRNRIPANMTNLAMADALQALPQVEGVGEILEALQVQSAQKPTPAPPRTGRRTAAASRKKVVDVEEEEPREGQASPLPGARRVSASAVKFMSLGGDEAMEEGVKQKEAAETPRAPTTGRRVGSRKTEEWALEAPATGQKTATTRRRAAKKDEEEEKEKLRGATASRRTRQSAAAADLISRGLRRSARVRGKETVKMESLTKDEAAGDVVSGFEGSPVSGLISDEQKDLNPEVAAEISPEELNLQPEEQNLQPELHHPDETPADDEVTAPATCNLASETPAETKAAELSTEVVESVEDNGEILAGIQDVEAPATCDQINLAAEIVHSAVVDGEIKEDGEDESEPSFDVLVDNGEVIGEESGKDSGESNLSFDVIVDDGEITREKEKVAGESDLSFDVIVDDGEMKEEDVIGACESDPSFDVLVGECSAGSDSSVESPLEIVEPEEAGIRSAAAILAQISPEKSKGLMGSVQSEMTADAIKSSVGGGSPAKVVHVVGEIAEKGDESIPEKSKVSEVTGDISEEAMFTGADDGGITEESEDESGTEDTNSLTIEVPVEKVSDVTGEISVEAVFAGADDGEITDQSEDESCSEDTDSLTVEVPVEEDESRSDLDNGILAVPVEAVGEQKLQPPAEVRELIDHLADLKLSSAMKTKSAGAEQPAAAVVKSDKENSSLLTVLTAGPIGGGNAKARPNKERPKPKYEEMSLTKLRAAYKETLSTISNKGEEKRAALRAIDDNCMI